MQGILSRCSRAAFEARSLQPEPMDPLKPMRNTFPCIYTHLSRSSWRGTRSLRQRSGRGFTLIELMVVVVIITVLSAIALPGISRRLKSSRTKEAGDRIGDIFRSARLRALGRGAAILVRYDTGVFTVREAIWGPTANTGCENIPVASCLEPGRWDDASTGARTLETFNFHGSGDFKVTADVGTNLDVCFSPSGRTFSRVNSAIPLAPMVAGVSFTVDHTSGGGFQRSVVVSPTGNARTVATP